MAGTLTPTPYQTVLDGDGVAVSGAKITTTDTGTGVNAATYTNAALSAANTNPIVTDSAGRYVAYLPAGSNFTFAITTSAGAAIETQTNIQAVPGSSVNLDIEGTVGVAVTAGQVLYLSSAAESVPLTAGKWYLTDSDAAATSTAPQSIGVAVSAIAINTAGTIRLAGEVNSAGTVVAGTTYYIGATPGAIVTSAPVLSRQVGVGLTTSSLLLASTTAVVGALPNPITQDLLFTDNTYDIGKSGASRPRDVFASRNAEVGGTLGVTGVATLSSQPVLSTLTASVAVFSDGSKGLVSNAITGTGNVVMSASPTLTGTIGAAAATFSGAVTLNGGLNTPLVVAQGGTGLSTIPAASVLVGAGTGNVASVAPSTAGNVLTSAGGNWTSAAVATATSLDTGTVAYAGRTITVDTGGSLDVVLASSAGDDFTVDTTRLVVSGDETAVGINTAAPVSLLDVRGPTGTGAASAGLMTLATNELTIVDNDQLGRVDFRAPIATAGTDAIVTAASIWAEANATFSSSVNAADIVFATATSGAVAEAMRITSAGNVSIPAGKITVTEGASGALGSANYDTAYIENGTHAGITVGSGATSNGALFFSDSGSSIAGGMIYYHATDKLDVYAAAATRMSITSSGVTIPGSLAVTGTTSGGGVGPIQHRISLTSGVSVTTANVTGASTIYLVPHAGNSAPLYDGSIWKSYTVSQLSISTSGGTASKPHDVFLDENGGTPVLALLAWTDDTNRATALALQDGVYCKTGDLSQRYVGTVYLDGSKDCEDTATNRYCWNYYNRAVRVMRKADSTNTWTYTTDTWRQAGGDTANVLSMVIGVKEDSVTATVVAGNKNSTSQVVSYSGIGVSTSAIASNCFPGIYETSGTNGVDAELTAFYQGVLNPGIRNLYWLERSQASGTCTWKGDNGASGSTSCGIFGTIHG